MVHGGCVLVGIGIGWYRLFVCVWLNGLDNNKNRKWNKYISSGSIYLFDHYVYV